MSQTVVLPKEHSLTTFAFAPGRRTAVDSGATVAFHTNDDVYQQLSQGARFKKTDGTVDDITSHLSNSNINNSSSSSGGGGLLSLEEINRVTGPVHVNGATAGDALAVTIISIEIARCFSVWAADPSVSGCLAAKRQAIAAHNNSNNNSNNDSKNNNDGWSVRELPIDQSKQTVAVSSRMGLPLEPMIGCIATAPPPHSTCSFGCGCSTFEPTGRNGGNMDLCEMRAGTTVLLPVSVDGGLLYIGDLHAAMGRGEATWVGFEASGTAVVRIELIKQRAQKFPVLYIPRTLSAAPVVHAGDKEGFGKIPVDGVVIFTAVDETHLQATQLVLSEAYDHLVNVEQLTGEEAFGFLTAQSEVRFGGPASVQALLVLPSPQPFLTS